jgi:hypothetical protein
MGMAILNILLVVREGLPLSHYQVPVPGKSLSAGGSLSLANYNRTI